nr:chloride channel protein [Isoptericola halotolerans]
MPWILLAGVLVGVAVRWLPGRGGHVPVDGLALGPVPAASVPGILLAALGGLPLGAVLGPEGPLLALGSAVALLLVRPIGKTSAPTAQALLTVAGASAALAAIFGSPLVAAVFVLEAVGLAGPRLARVILPCLLASGVGALVFTGMGSWTGLEIASLSLPEIDGPQRPDLGDVLWTVPFAVLIAFGVRQVHQIGHRVARIAAGRPARTAVAAAVTVGLCASAYSLLTGRSPEEVVLSGQSMLEPLVSDAPSWPLLALVALVVFKALAYGVSLGALRGGPIFPALLLGAALGVLASGLPGFGVVPAVAAGMAAATATTLPLPVSSAVLVILLLGPNGAAMAPVVLIAVVVAFVVEQMVLTQRRAG